MFFKLINDVLYRKPIAECYGAKLIADEAQAASENANVAAEGAAHNGGGVLGGCLQIAYRLPVFAHTLPTHPLSQQCSYIVCMLSVQSLYNDCVLRLLGVHCALN